MSRQAALADLKEFSVWIRKWFIVHLNEESRSLYTKDGENRETMMSESSQQTTSVIVKWNALLMSERKTTQEDSIGFFKVNRRMN